MLLNKPQKLRNHLKQQLDSIIRSDVKDRYYLLGGYINPILVAPLSKKLDKQLQRMLQFNIQFEMERSLDDEMKTMVEFTPETAVDMWEL